jgi:hypothetical protein
MNRTITLTNEQFQILSDYKELGFNTESELLNYAILFVQKEKHKLNDLKMSADLYSEIYQSDQDLRDLTSPSQQKIMF